MALDRSKLQRGILAAIREPSQDYSDAARKFAQAYTDYAREAQSCQGVPPLGAQIDAAHQILSTSLNIAFRAGFFLPSTIQNLSAAFAAF